MSFRGVAEESLGVSVEILRFAQDDRKSNRRKGNLSWL